MSELLVVDGEYARVAKALRDVGYTVGQVDVCGDLTGAAGSLLGAGSGAAMSRVAGVLDDKTRLLVSELNRGADDAATSGKRFAENEAHVKARFSAPVPYQVIDRVTVGGER